MVNLNSDAVVSDRPRSEAAAEHSELVVILLHTDPDVTRAYSVKWTSCNKETFASYDLLSSTVIYYCVFLLTFFCSCAVVTYSQIKIPICR